jgi:hypothetical protein
MPPDDRADITTLVSLYDTEFVGQAFRTILGRDADAHGHHHYLMRVRAGASKVSVIADLAASREGRGRGVRIDGLSRYRAMTIVGRIPVVGRLVEAIVFLCRTREITRDLRRMENFLYRLMVEIESIRG